MADFYSYNGIFLPGMEFDPVTYDYVLHKHATANVYYMMRSEANIRFRCYSDGTVGHTGYVDKYSQATHWVGDDCWYGPGGMYPGGIPLENVLWSYNDILYEDGTVAFKGSNPVLVTGATLEATYTGNLEITAYGNTGIILGAKVKYPESGNVVDISDEATYNAYAVDETYKNWAVIVAGRELYIIEGCPLNSVRIEVTWDKLPGLTATLTASINIDAGGGNPEDPEDPEDPEETVTPDAKRLAFWRGFGSLVGMYGGIVSEADESVGTGEADSKGEYLRKMFWLGASCGAAMYGGGRFNT